MAWKLRIKPDGAKPIYRQIEEALREAIDNGNLKPGDRVPSVADLAEELKVNKLTVHKVFRRLEKAGLVHSEVGRGTFIARADQAAPASANGFEPRPEVARSIRRMREGFARGLSELISIERRPGTINLSGGVPNPAMVAQGLLEKLARDVLKRNPQRVYEYAGPAGLAELRETLAARFKRHGVAVSPNEIIITNGSQQAIALVAAWARDDGRSIICEAPTYTGLPSCFMLFGHAVQSVAWRDGAPDLDNLRAASTGRRVVFYVCPDFHNPTGQTMSASAREELSGWARHSDAIVIDDEIFRDLRFDGEEPPGLYSVLPAGRRVLVGSISKSFMPGLRAGFLAADRTLVDELLPYKRFMDTSGPSLTQAITAAFLREGYDKHLAAMRAYYRERRDAALSALKEHMPEGVTWTRPQGGFQLWVTMPRGLSSIQLFLAAIEQGVSINPGPAHDIDGRFVNCFRLGYGHVSPAEIRTGIQRLGVIIRRLSTRSSAHESAVGLGILP
jgi:2-aminoadipate transaminase